MFISGLDLSTNVLAEWYGEYLWECSRTFVGALAVF